MPAIVFDRSLAMFSMMVLLCGALALALICSAFFTVVFLPFIFSARWQTIFFALPILGLVVSGKGLFDLYRQFKARNRPMVLLDEAGLHVWQPYEEVLPWNGLTSVRAKRIGKAMFLLLGVVGREHYLRVENRWFNGELGINLLPLKGPSSDVIRAIRSYPLYVGRDKIGEAKGT